MDGESGYDQSRIMPQVTPVVKILLAVNSIVFFLDLLAPKFLIGNFAAFSIRSAIHEGRFWEFVTFQFMHGSVGHWLMNSLGLYFFGPWMERWWGSKSFLLFYLLCGVAGAGLFLLLAYVGILRDVGLDTGLVGASAGIYGILVGVAMVAPALRVRLLIPPVTLTMRQLALFTLVFAVCMIATNWINPGGEAGHLGGALMGAALVWLWRQGGVLRSIRSNNKAMPMRGRKIMPKIHPRTVIDLDASSEVDRILDKISREGFQSLTKAEKEALQVVAKRGQD